MKKDNKKPSNAPFYSKFEKPAIVKTSEKIERDSDKKRLRTTAKKDFDKPTFAKSFDKPYDREKRNFDKPFEKRGDRPERGDRPDFKKPYDRPYDREKRNFDKPFDKRDERPRPDRDDRLDFKKPYDKPYDREKRSSDKPFDKRDERPRPDRGDRPDFKKPYDKPYDREKRSFDKPFDKRDERPRPDRGDRPDFKKPYDKPYDHEKRSSDKPFDKHDERPRPDRGDRPDFKKPYDKPYDREKRSFEKPFEKGGFEKPFERTNRNEDPMGDNEKRSRSDDGERRRVGDFAEAPRYDLRHAEERYHKKTKTAPKADDGFLRLNKYIANAGLCSRREADELIESGQITVNGKVITEMGYKVAKDAVVKYGTRVLNPEKMVYILVNKPKDYITTTDDPEGRHTVMELIAGACQERVYPVGRLDRNTTGLLLLTNDGELAEKLMHPSNEVKKIYQVEIDKPITTLDFEKIKEGLELEDGFIKPDDVALVTPDAMVLGIEIHSGRNRIVRRIFESLGYEVLKLDRTVYAGLTKKEVPRGKWRFLNEKEVVKLKYLV